MSRMQMGIGNILIVGLLATGTLAPTRGWSQTPLQQLEQQLRAKQQAADTHLRQMERLTDPAQLAMATQRQLHLTQEILALLLEHQTLLAAQVSQSSALAGGDEPKRGGQSIYLRSNVGRDPRQGVNPRLTSQ
jgi:hypothetical protein